MAFNTEQLAQGPYNAAVPGQSRTLWLYANSENDNIDGAGFFNDAAHMLREGDFIFDGGGTGKIRAVDGISAEGVVTLGNPDVAAAD